MSKRLHEWLVTHRLRGFGEHENSLSALEAALARGVGFVEIDTRSTADREILVFHDARLDPLTDQAGPVAAHRLQLDGRPRYGGREPVPTLEEFLARFAGASETAELLIDVKDPGVEAEHVRAIETAGLGNRVRVMSWWPEVLRDVHALAPGLRLVFSHVPLRRGPWWLHSVRWFGSGGAVRLLGRLRGDSRQARYMQDTWFRHEPLAPLAPSVRATGRYPVCFTRGLPDGDLSAVLAASGGGIATWPRVIDRELVSEARQRGLEVIAFSLDRAEEIETLHRRVGPLLVFTNNASFFRAGV